MSDMTSSNASAAGGSRLMDKLQSKHTSTIQKFYQDVRDVCQQIDLEAVELLSQLRSRLTESRSTTEATLQHEESALESHQALLAAEAASFAGRTRHDDAVPLKDRFHNSGVHSTETRDANVSAERKRILTQYGSFTDAHRGRMTLIHAAADALTQLEGRRCASLRSLMEGLMGDLSTIAFRGVTESHVLVQRAAASINEQLIGNQRTVRSLVSQLLQHELMKQRDYAETCFKIFKLTMSAAQESTLLWTRQLLCSKAFRFPHSRTAMLHRIHQALAKTKGEVSHALEGLTSVVETLRRTRPSAMAELCGGTESNGWLRSATDSIFQPVFPEDPTKVADEWRVFMEVILHNAQCSVVTLSEDTQTIEMQLQSEMRRICDAALHTIEILHNPSEEEIALMRHASLDGANLYPFHSCALPHHTASEEGKQQARDCLAPICRDIVEESQWFQQHVAKSLQQQKQTLEELLARGEGNVVKTFLDATVSVRRAAENPLQYVRRFFVTQYEAEKDYEDNLQWMEKDVADVTSRLQHAGTEASAKQLCIQGMQLLDGIEKLHVQYHKQRVSKLQNHISECDTILDSEEKQLFGKLNVAPKSDSHTDGSVLSASEKSPVRRQSKMSASGSVSASNLALMTGPTLVVADAVFVILGPLRFGYSDGSEKKLGSQQHDDASSTMPTGGAGNSNQTPRDAKPEAAKKAPPAKAGGKGAPKAPAPDEALLALQVQQAEEAAALAAQQQMQRLKAFIDRMMPLFDDVFVADCMISTSCIETLRDTLRVTLVEWFLQTRQRTRGSIRAYCDTTKEVMDKQTNEVIRRHQRRAPTLQAQTYESRVRELHDGLVSRAKHFEWLQHRVEGMRHAAEQFHAKCIAAFDEDADSLDSLIQGVHGVMSLPALESHQRSITEHVRNVLSRMHARKLEYVKVQQGMLASVVQEAASYESEKLKPFDLGGTMSVDEVETAKQQLRSIVSGAQGAHNDYEVKLDALMKSQQDRLEAARGSYAIEKQRSADEFRFFSEMQEILAQLKGRIGNQIATSGTAQKQLEDLLQKLAELVSHPAAQKSSFDIASLRARFSTNYESEYSSILASRAAEVASIPADWSGADERLSKRLIRTQLTIAGMLRQSIPMQILQIIDELRRVCYARGVFLGSLQFMVDYIPVHSDSFLDPKRDGTGTTNAPAAADSKKPAPKGKAAAPAPKAAVAQPGSGPTPSGDQPAAAAAPPPAEKVAPQLPKVTRGDAELLKWSRSSKEAALSASAAFFQKRSSILRSGVLGGTLEEVNTTIHARIAEQEARFQSHVTEASKVFREQIQRLFVLLHASGTATLNGLLSLSAQTLQLKLADVMDVFDVYVAAMMNFRDQHSSQVKSSLALPGNRGKLERIELDERQRQAACAALIKKFLFIAVRELQDEANSTSGRLCHSIQTWCLLLRGLVMPEHVVPGEDIVAGDHRNLKKLLRQRLREEAARELDAGGASPAKDGKKGADAAKDKDPKAKPDAKKADKPAPKGKGGKGGADAGGREDEEGSTIPALERQMHEFVGAVVNRVRLLSRHRSLFPDTPVPPNHYNQPSQWEADRVAAQLLLEADQAAAAEAAKKSSAAKVPPKPSGKAAAPNSGGANGGAGGSSEAGVDEVSASVIAPRDRLHQQTVMHRNGVLENIAAGFQQLGGSVESMFLGLEKSEKEWSTRWQETIRSLRPEL